LGFAYLLAWLCGVWPNSTVRMWFAIGTFTMFVMLMFHSWFDVSVVGDEPA
jgi:hypothetical protein